MNDALSHVFFGDCQCFIEDQMRYIINIISVNEMYYTGFHCTFKFYL